VNSSAVVEPPARSDAAWIGPPSELKVIHRSSLSMVMTEVGPHYILLFPPSPLLEQG
jgi:hypothetical protein